MSLTLHGIARVAPILLLPLLMAGCGGQIQSSLTPRGPEAREIAVLFWVMTVAGFVILVGVMLLAAAAIRGGPGLRRVLSGEAMVIGGGIVFPVVILTLLLGWGLLMMSASRSQPGENAVRISVIGERWWWRVLYRGEDGDTFESANEIRIPVNRPVRFELTSADVIHSFWIPNLAGKLDMIPGRQTVLRLSAAEPGIFRGQCAEYCGGAHALMAFQVLALDDNTYAAWRRREAGDALPPSGPEAQQGQMLFAAYGCGACHSIRGTGASGTIGPDLTHFGARRTLAAATLPNTVDNTARWIARNSHIKPENLMPDFGVFRPAELDALARYLHGLR